MDEIEKQQLDRDGYVALAGFMSPDLLKEVRARAAEVLRAEGALAGAEFRQEPGARRLANLVNKGEVFQRLVACAPILERVAYVLGSSVKLSSLNYRAAEPYSAQGQPLHCDAGALPDERGPWVCNVIWMLDDFTTENGATRIVPGSHRWGRLPQDSLADPAAPHPAERLLTGAAGTVIVMNTHAWHGATANRTGGPRRALHSFYCRRDKPQQQYQKALLDPEVQRTLSPPLRELLALDDPLNDALSETQSGASGFLR